MKNENTLNDTIELLKKQVTTFRTLSTFAIILSLALGIYIFAAKAQSEKLITTQGIVITDANGKDRILIGSPIPFSADRVRTDSARAWETYIAHRPKDFQEKAWNFYKEYSHSTNGIVLLSESGYDRIVLGDPTPDPPVGTRILPGTGFVINDELGWERSGYGIMKTGEKDYRVALGMDSNTGSEGVMLQIDDQGPNGLIMPSSERFIFLGNSDTSFFVTQPYDKYNGLMIRSMDSIYVDLQ